MGKCRAFWSCRAGAGQGRAGERRCDGGCGAAMSASCHYSQSGARRKVLRLRLSRLLLLAPCWLLAGDKLTTNYCCCQRPSVDDIHHQPATPTLSSSRCFSTFSPTTDRSHVDIRIKDVSLRCACGSFSRIRQLAPMCAQCWFLELARIPFPVIC